MVPAPARLYPLSVITLVVAGVCAIAIVVDIARGNRQRMWIMEVVWPLTALYAGPLGLWAYLCIGRLSTRAKAASEEQHEPTAGTKPFWQARRTAAAAARWGTYWPSPSPWRSPSRCSAA